MSDTTQTTYLRQYKVNTTRDGKTVSGHVTLTEGIFHGLPSSDGIANGKAHFIMESRKAPAGLPIIDQSTPVGSHIIPLFSN